MIVPVRRFNTNAYEMFLDGHGGLLNSCANYSPRHNFYINLDNTFTKIMHQLMKLHDMTVENQKQFLK